jgi:hypothetical protein
VDLLQNIPEQHFFFGRGKKKFRIFSEQKELSSNLWPSQPLFYIAENFGSHTILSPRMKFNELLSWTKCIYSFIIVILAAIWYN